MSSFRLLAAVCLHALSLPAAAQSAAAASEYAAVVGRVVSRGVHAGGFAGAAVSIGNRDTTLVERGFGRTSWIAGASVVTASGTSYDLASLTKVVATTSAIMLLVDEGRVELDDPVKRHLREFGGAGRDAITIRDLLMHRGGLPAGPDMRRAESPAAARRAVLSTTLAYRPGTRTLYSDVGPMILAMVAERVTGEPLDRFVNRRVFVPSGMRHTGFGAPLGTFAASTGSAGDGAVHDANARRLGGVAGHAGLFSTAPDLARFARLLLNGGVLDGVRIFSDTTVALFTSRQVDGRPLGWDMCPGGGRCGLRMSDSAFGHTGFTGTSMWIDPEQGVFAIVLTNAVLEPRAYDPVAVLSDVRADIADLAVCSSSGAGVGEIRLRAEIAINWFRAGATPVSMSGY
jgi:CubicO group peptidase (beta-lactamase class C family)